MFIFALWLAAQVPADWAVPDDNHQRLAEMAVEAHTRGGVTDWPAALADYRNRATAAAMWPEVRRQLEQNHQRARAEAVNRGIRRENGTSRVTTTCHTSASSFYPSATTTCTTREE